MSRALPQVPASTGLRHDFDSAVRERLLERDRGASNVIRITASVNDPTTRDVPDGTALLWRNDVTGVLKLWANDGGVMKSVTLT